MLNLGFVGLVQMVPMFLFTFHAGHVADNHNRKSHSLDAVALGATCRRDLVSMFNKDVVWMYCCLFMFGVARTYMWAALRPLCRNWSARGIQPRGDVEQRSHRFPPPPVLPSAACDFHHWPRLDVMPSTSSLRWFPSSLPRCALTKVAAKEECPSKRCRASLRLSHQGGAGASHSICSHMLLGGATAILPGYAAHILHVGPGGLGWLQAALPLGSLLMSVVLVHRPPLQKAGQTLLWSVIGFGLATIGFGYSTVFWLSFLMLFLWRCGQHQRRGPPSPGANAPAGRKTGPRLRRQQPLHRHLQPDGRI
jgi:hypothetical protein